MKTKKITLIIAIPILFFAVLFIACSSNKYSKEKFHSSKAIGDNLYREEYVIYSGNATTTDVNSVYITDSIHFRKFIGTEDYPYRIITAKKIGDVLHVQKKEEKFFSSLEISYDTIIQEYNINELIKEGKFE
jgi:hypothetical protein